jgi:hypothetical protein
MAPVGAVFGVALALLRDRVDQDRAVGARLDRAQDGKQLFHVVAVDGADIGKAQFLEERAADGRGLEQFLGPPRAFLEGFGQERHRALGRRLQLLERRAGVKAREVGGHRARGRRDGHLVVVQDDDQARAQVARVVHRLVGHAARERAVADHGNGVAMAGGAVAAELAGEGEAERGRNTCRRMRGAERVIGAPTAW